MQLPFVKLRARIDKRSMRMLVAAGTSYLARFGSAAVVLINIPMAKRELEPEMFGVWMMLSSLVAFFSFTDLGVGNAVTNRITAAQASGNQREVGRVITSGYACMSAIACAFLSLWLIWMATSPEPTSATGVISQKNRVEVLMALNVFVLLFAVNIPAGMIQMVQLGAQQGSWVGLTQLSAAVLTLIGVPIALTMHAPLAWVLVASFGSVVAANIVSSVCWLRRRKLLPTFRWRVVEWSTIKDLLRTGAAFFVLQLAVAFAFQSDAIVITHTLGQAAYGDFAIVQKLYQVASILLGAATVGLWPAFGDAVARGDLTWARVAFRRSMLGTGIGVGAICLVLLSATGWITRLWVGMQVAPPFMLVATLAAWTFVGALGSISGAFMNGANLLRIQAISAVGMATLAFGGKWLLTPLLGPAGAVLATLLAYCAISVPAQIIVYRRFFARAEARG